MVFIGIGLIMIGLVAGINTLVSEMWKASVIFGIIFLLGIGLVVYDKTSPVEETHTEVITNDYAKYDLAIDSDLLGMVRMTRVEATRFGAISGDGVKYSFVGFVEEDG